MIIYTQELKKLKSEEICCKPKIETLVNIVVGAYGIKHGKGIWTKTKPQEEA